MFTEHTVSSGGVGLFVRSGGPDDGPVLILLHGWPDTGEGWMRIAPLLTDRYRVIVPDNRGFGRSGMPEGTDAYRIPNLVGDVATLIGWSGAERVGLVGHDFGGALAWASGVLLADRIDRMVVLAAPHPMHMQRVGVGNTRQLRTSFYSWLMNTGPEGEAVLAQDDFRFLARMVFGDVLAKDELDARRANWAEPGRFTAMAEWYRANFRPSIFDPARPIELPPVTVPTRYIHGRLDFAFAPEMATGSADFVAAECDEVVLEDSTHWMTLEQPQRVADLISEWMGR